MQTIGERLEEARKRKGISIREAAESTKIRGDYLQKFEANSFGIDLPPLYIRGFLRSYSRYLELDPERIVGDFNTLLATEGKTTRRDSREVFGRVDFGDGTRGPEGTEAAPAGARSAQDRAVLLKFALLGGGALLVIVAVVLLFNVLFSHSPSKGTTMVSPAASTASSPSAAREATFTITATEPTRVKVAYQDNSTVFLDGKYPLGRGEVKNITFAKNLIVTVEYPDRLRIELNGRSVEVPTNKPMGQFIVPYEQPAQ